MHIPNKLEPGASLIDIVIISLYDSMMRLCDDPTKELKN